MITITHVQGAYGKIYNTKEKAQKAWVEGKDFCDIYTRQYCSKRDFTILDSVFVQLENGSFVMMENKDD